MALGDRDFLSHQRFIFICKTCVRISWQMLLWDLANEHIPLNGSNNICKQNGFRIDYMTPNKAQPLLDGHYMHTNDKWPRWVGLRKPLDYTFTAIQLHGQFMLSKHYSEELIVNVTLIYPFSRYIFKEFNCLALAVKYAQSVSKGQSITIHENDLSPKIISKPKLNQ